MGAVTAWVDKDGHTHKEKPAQESTGHPCTFSGFSAALDLPDLGAAVVAPRPVQTALLITRIAEVAIGRGLAAPPPPPTGPPPNLCSCYRTHSAAHRLGTMVPGQRSPGVGPDQVVPTVFPYPFFSQRIRTFSFGHSHT